MGADIQLLITDITDYRDLMVAHTTDDKANLRALDEEIEILEYRQAQIDSRLGKRKTAKEEYLKTLNDTEKAFNQIVNTANAVAGILKPKSASELASMDAPKSVAKAGDYRGKD
jgi:formiminotetrahydrofolate cyclodeaminase